MENLKKYKLWLVFMPLGAFLLIILKQLSSGVLHIDIFGFVHEAAGLCIGAFIVAAGFKSLKRKWFIDNIPTSKVRSAAMGFTELCGKAVIKEPLVSRLAIAKCVYYRFKIEKERRGSRGGRYWDVIIEGSSSRYFYVEDETGKLLVDPLDAEIMIDKVYKNIEKGGGSRTRYTEWYIEPGDNIYLLGEIRKSRDVVQDRKEKILERLRKLKENREDLLRKFDADKDGQISPEEWDKARESVENDILQEELNATQPAEEDVMISKGGNERGLLISDCSEKKISNRLLGRTLVFLFLGGMLSAAVMISALARAGALPPVLAFNWELLYK